MTDHLKDQARLAKARQDAAENLTHPDPVVRKGAIAASVVNRPDSNPPPAAEYLAISQNNIRGQRIIEANGSEFVFKDAQYATNSAEEAAFLATQPGVSVEHVGRQSRRTSFFIGQEMPWKVSHAASVDEQAAGEPVVRPDNG